MSIFAPDMLSNKRKKELVSLKQKKYRQRYGQFIVEGEKSVLELCQSRYEVIEIFVSPALFQKLGTMLKGFKIAVADEKDLQQISAFDTAPGIIAVSSFKDTALNNPVYEQQFTLLLDGISDPGNLGTILRIADWYGIQTVICSPDCVDLYNPKTIASSMGSFTRVNVWVEEPEKILRNCGVETFACVMNGRSLQEVSRPAEGLILIGNEARGIREDLVALATQRITIPRIGAAESLNAGIAAAVVCHKLILG